MSALRIPVDLSSNTKPASADPADTLFLIGTCKCHLTTRNELACIFSVFIYSNHKPEIFRALDTMIDAIFGQYTNVRFNALSLCGYLSDTDNEILAHIPKGKHGEVHLDISS